jgi:ABC-type multidrug transport system permease subunit
MLASRNATDYMRASQKGVFMANANAFKPNSPANVARIALGTAMTVFRNKLQMMSLPFYVLVFLGFPFFQLMLIALIYRENPALQDYAVIAGAGTAFIFAMLFVGGEVMEGERERGTLGNLFVSPAPRYAWLLGFQLSSALEAMLSAILTLALGITIFGTSLSVNGPSLIVTLFLLILCMWGISMMASAVGTAIRNANQLSNLLFPILMPLAGTMFPIAEMPGWLRSPARCLPFGYGMQALVDAMTRNASLIEMRDDLLPLAGFAVLLPALGGIAFKRLDVYARVQGHLEMT